MTHLIDKSALVAEIKKRRKAIPRDETDKRLKAVYGNEAFVLVDLLDFLDTLEVKEVDLEKEVIDWWSAHYSKDYTFERYAGHYLENSTIIDIAKHFFELGLKAQKGE